MQVGEGLPPSVQSLLNDLAVLERFRAQGHRPSFGNLTLWGDTQPRATDFIHSVHGHGYQLDRTAFDRMLRGAAVENGATLCEGSRLVLEQSVDFAASTHTLRLSDGGGSELVSVRWVLDASGRSATLARRLGAKRLRQDRLTAFSMLLTTASRSDRDGRTLVEATEHGWWYSALLPTGSRLVTHLTDSDLADRHALLSAHGLHTELSKANWLFTFCKDHSYAARGVPQGCDASSGRLNRFAGPRWLAAGDAALSFDPLSSQGIGNALYTGMHAGDAVASALAGNNRPVARYCSHLSAIYRTYLRHRYDVYIAESRWPHSAFWQRRQAALPASQRAGHYALNPIAQFG